MQTPRDRMRERIKVICESYGVEPARVLSPSRKKVLMPARRAIAFFLRNERHMTYPRIGALMSGRDHSTVIYYLRGHKKKGESDGRPAR